jgi:preprotein translocase subunit SecY
MPLAIGVSTVDGYEEGLLPPLLTRAFLARFNRGVMPYISASIIIQMLQIVVPSLQKKQQEGESGRREINQITRVSATVLAAFQAFGIGIFLLSQNGLVVSYMEAHRTLFLLSTVLAITTGCTILMWVGERITDKGIGNGVSLVIAFGIMAHYPGTVLSAIRNVKADALEPIWIFVVLALCIVTTMGIILTQEGARKIPIQHAKRVVGRKMQVGQTNFLPLKVNTAGVIPVIFASSLLALPATALSFLGAGDGHVGLGEWFALNSMYNVYNWLGMERQAIYLLLKILNLHTLLYVLLVLFFCYFYTAIVFNPVELAENLKKNGAYVPGLRPGKPTADYIDQVLSRITLVGAVFLIVVSLIPQALHVSFNVDFLLADIAGGTGLIIVVGVVLQTMQMVDSQLLMKHYEGFQMKRQGAGERWSARTRSTQTQP